MSSSLSTQQQTAIVRHELRGEESPNHLQQPLRGKECDRDREVQQFEKKHLTKLFTGPKSEKEEKQIGHHKVPIVMATKFLFTVMALVVDYNEGDVMPPCTFAKGR